MKKSAFLFVVVAGILWGTSAVFVHFLAPFGFTSLQMTFVRSLTSSVFFCVYIIFKKMKIHRISAGEVSLLFASGFSFFCTASCYYTSMQLTSVSTAVVLMYSSPILVMVYSVIFLGEKLNLRKSLLIISMVVGCCLVSGIIGERKFQLIGIVFGILSGMAYSAYNILTKIIMKKEINPYICVFYCFSSAMICSALICNPQEIPTLICKSPTITLPLLIGLGICTCILPYFLYTVSLKHLPVSTASALSIIEPMSSTIFGVLFWKEHIQFSSFVGIVIIFGVVILLSKCNE